MHVQCTGCQKTLDVPDSAAGKQVRCPLCQAVFAVPAPVLLAEIVPAETAVTPDAPSPAPANPRESVSAEPRLLEPARRGDDDRREDERPRRRDEYDDDDRPRRRRRRDEGGGDVVETFIPYKNGMALAAYYCGVFGLIPCIGLIVGTLALIFGIIGLRRANQNPEVRGGGHAIAGIVLGSLEILGNIIFIVLVIIGMSARR